MWNEVIDFIIEFNEIGFINMNLLFGFVVIIFFRFVIL